MQYADIAIRISPGIGNRYGVAVTSPQGGAESALELPFAIADLAGVVQGVAETIRGDAEAEPDTRDSRPYRKLRSDTGRARDLGVQLYQALFSPDVQSVLDRTLGSVREKRNTGVRVRLLMDIQGEGMAELASLPWELMARAPADIPLAMFTRTVLVRSLDVLQPTDPIPFEPPLRILVVASNPRGTTPLRLEDERRRIEKSWSRLPGVRVDFVRPIVTELLDQLASEDYHVIHFMGHGEFDRKTGRGALLLEREDGSSHPVDADQLKVMLSDEPLLRLVFLNACKTGTSSDSGGLDPFAGVATAFIRMGVPAVVAMQFPISDDAAVTFADTFYRRIADGHPVDTAVTEGRKALWGGAHSEWVTPVLFMRSTDGVLFEPAEAHAGAQPAFVPGTMQPDRDQGLRLFLAAPNEGLRPVHRQLASELASGGRSVTANVPPPHEEMLHEEEVRKLARRCDLFVHLLGDGPGELLDVAEPGRTFTLEQLRIGLESARSQLILMPEHLDPAGFADAEYAALIRQLIERPRESERFELIRTGRHQMRDEILGKCRRLEEAKRRADRSGSGAVERAFVDLHSTDIPHTRDLVEHLHRRRITSIMIPSTELAPTAALSLFEENLKNVHLFIVIYGAVAREWVLSRLNAAAQVITLNGLATRIGVYLAPPEKSSHQVRFQPFVYEVAANMSRFEPRTIDALIDRASGGQT